MAKVLLAGGVIAMCVGYAGAQGNVAAWVEDALVRVFADAQPPTPAVTTIALQAAIGEYESGQIAIRSDMPLKAVTARATDLVSADGKAQIAAGNVRCRFVGAVLVEKSTPRTAREELERLAPAVFPDPIFEDVTRDVPAAAAQAIWVTLAVPYGAKPGRYTGSIELAAEGQTLARVPLELEVWPFEMPRERHLLFTNWFSAGRFARQYKVEAYSDEFYRLFERYVANLAAHRQNIVWFDPGAVQISEDQNGELSFDFARLDRWVEICEKYGAADRIEIAPVGRHKGDWSATEFVLRSFSVTSAKTGKTESRAGEEILPQYLPALVQHLRARGWLEKTLLHIADEPAPHNIESWRKLSAWVHSLAPELRRIDAIEAPDFGDDLEVWVPKLTHYDNWRQQYEQARQRGKELWYYTCLHPTGGYPNRFVDFPLIKTRILHWLNWRYDLAGYLHWGLLAWTDDPFANAASGTLPPGDAWIIYPGPDGPLDSLRWESLRDGIEDYEYLWLLTEAYGRVQRALGDTARDIQAKNAADYYARQAVPAFQEFVRNPRALRGLRSQVAQEIIQANQPPLLLVEVGEPETRDGVQSVRVRAVSEPGSILKLEENDQAVPIPQGNRLERAVTLGDRSVRVIISATKGNETKSVTRVIGPAPPPKL